ncbi:hypothetical protein ABDB91_08490 [Desulfoscipio sp. XC116]|uniref:hypothetical protein n=1 Tax=Desulfoscipio sp. XC116 TaxID=3144975 RepID=UPI00325B127D
MMAKHHDAGKRFEVWMHGSLLVLSTEDLWELLKHSPGIWKRAIQRGKGVRRSMAMEKRQNAPSRKEGVV